MQVSLNVKIATVVFKSKVKFNSSLAQLCFGSYLLWPNSALAQFCFASTLFCLNFALLQPPPLIVALLS